MSRPVAAGQIRTFGGLDDIFQLERAQADDRLLRLQFAIIIAPGNLRPGCGQTYVPVFGLLLPDRTWMVGIWRETLHRERGSGR
jgi:hypothetical protein